MASSQSVAERTIDNQLVDVDLYADFDAYHALLAKLRGEDPVRWSEPDDYDPFWMVTKHADIVEVQRQPQLFPSGGRVQLTSRAAEAEIAALTGGRLQVQRSIVALNGAEHTAIRNVTREYFLPRGVNALDNRIQAIASEFVDRLEALGGRCDFAQDVAVWYPLRVILMMFGLPPEAEPLMLRLSKEVNGARDPDTRRASSEGQHLIEVMSEMFGYFAEVAEDRRQRPRDDLATIIATATVAGEPIKDLDVFSYYLSITVAGHDTTSASTSAGVEQLIRNPGELAKLRENPDLLGPAVDEMIRWTAPVKHFFRTAAEDYVLRGRRIRKGDNLLMSYPSACRDEEVFDDPFAFRVDRAPNPHLAFGIGPHLCMGQYLARTEMTAFFRELLSRVDDLALDGEPEQSRTLFMGGLKHLPIRYRMR